ncbi:MAG: prolipoprotein diacylglyceryl transferase [Clostridia bacterium]|nr:prolipoprotein diacylglyceryl transferase [Clostridia bacterium]
MSKLSFPGLGIGEYEINKVALSLFDGKVEIRWYAVIITLGIVLAALYVWFRFKENGLKGNDFLDLAIWVIISGIIGARLYFIIFKLNDYIVTSYDNFFQNLGESLKRMVDVASGGLAIYGGVIAGGLAAFFVAKRKKLNIFQILDFLAPAVMMAQALGRWGNYFNIEAFGAVTDAPWRMCSPVVANYLYNGDQIDLETKGKILTGELGVHPTFFYESMWNLIGFLAIVLIFVTIKKTKKLHKFHGQLFYSYLIWYGLGRLWIEGLRTDSLYLIPNVIRVSQLVALISFLAGTALMVLSFVLLKKKKEVFFARPIKYGADGRIIKDEQADKKEQSEEKENGTNNKRKTSVPKRKRKSKKRN